MTTILLLDGPWSNRKKELQCSKQCHNIWRAFVVKSRFYTSGYHYKILHVVFSFLPLLVCSFSSHSTPSNKKKCIKRHKDRNEKILSFSPTIISSRVATKIHLYLIFDINYSRNKQHHSTITMCHQSFSSIPSIHPSTFQAYPSYHHFYYIPYHSWRTMC